MIDDAVGLQRVCMLLAVLVNELRGLRNDLAGRKQSSKPRGLSDADMRALMPLLPAAAAAFREEEFTVGAMMARAKECQALRDAIANSSLNSLQLGWLLKRAATADECIAGLYVHFLRRTRTGAVFCVDENTAEQRAMSDFVSRMRENLSHD